MTNWPKQFDALIRQHCRLLEPGGLIDPEALLGTLGIDSLEVVEIIVEIEDVFDISIPPNLLTPEVFATPSTVWKMIESLSQEPVTPGNSPAAQ